MAVGCWLRAGGFWRLLFAGCLLLAAGCWMLIVAAAFRWLLIAGCWSLAVGCWMFAAGWLLLLSLEVSYCGREAVGG